jgi:hypothetical protein
VGLFDQGGAAYGAYGCDHEGWYSAAAAAELSSRGEKCKVRNVWIARPWSAIEMSSMSVMTAWSVLHVRLAVKKDGKSMSARALRIRRSSSVGNVLIDDMVKRYGVPCSI